MFTKQCNKLYFTSDTDNVNTSSFELFTDINVINNNIDYIIGMQHYMCTVYIQSM